MIEFARALTDALLLATEEGWSLALPNRVLGAGSSEKDALVENGSDSRFEWRPMKNGFAIAGAVRAIDSGGTRAAGEALYRDLLGNLGARRLYRVWNFVPRINELEEDLEVYQYFCYGRSEAFETAFADEFERRMPAASAVGTSGSHIGVLALAGDADAQYVENPLQIPAYRYPPQYGPRSPSFARGTVVASGGTQWLFISGTASIRGFETVHVGDLEAQIDLTLDNLRIVAKAADWSFERFSKGAEQRDFRVYVRRPEDFERVRQRLEGAYLRDGDRISYLQAEICRADLDVEIEVTLSRPR